jgi:predicted NodU family carbamoyl transferase
MFALAIAGRQRSSCLHGYDGRTWLRPLASRRQVDRSRSIRPARSGRQNRGIAAVVHVDGSARSQIIERETNPLYYDILAAFERESGLPVLVNTSFNVHEEPIVNASSECLKALTDGRIDFVVTTAGLYVQAA